MTTVSWAMAKIIIITIFILFLFLVRNKKKNRERRGTKQEISVRAADARAREDKRSPSEA